jgi:hypothetical protein
VQVVLLAVEIQELAAMLVVEMRELLVLETQLEMVERVERPELEAAAGAQEVPVVVLVVVGLEVRKAIFLEVEVAVATQEMLEVLEQQTQEMREVQELQTQDRLDKQQRQVHLQEFLLLRQHHIQLL